MTRSRATILPRPSMFAGRLIEHQLGCVFDRDDPLLIGHGHGDGAQQRGFSRSRSSRNQKILSPLHRDAQELRHRWGKHAKLLEIIATQSTVPETANRKRGPLQRNGRQRCIHPAAVWQAGVDHGGAFVDPPADTRRDALNDAHQMVGVAESHGRFFQTAKTLDENLLWSVDQDICDGWIGHERGQRSHAQRFFKQVLLQPLALLLVERQLFKFQHGLDELVDHAAEYFFAGVQQILAIQLIKQSLVQSPFDAEVVAARARSGLDMRRARLSSWPRTFETRRGKIGYDVGNRLT